MNHNELCDALLAQKGGLEENSLTHKFSIGEINEEDVLRLDMSLYYDLNTLYELVHENTAKFSIWNQNIDSINSKFEEFKAIIENLKESENFEWSCITLQQTMHSENDDMSLYELENYTIIH